MINPKRKEDFKIGIFSPLFRKFSELEKQIEDGGRGDEVRNHGPGPRGRDEHQLRQ